MPIFWRVLIIKRMLNFIKGFFCIYWDYHMVFTFQFVNMVYHIVWFGYTEESLHSWNKPNLIMVYEILMCCWILFTKILLRIFAFMFKSDVGLWFSFFVLCLVLVLGWWQPRRMSLEVFLPLQFFERVLEG